MIVSVVGLGYIGLPTAAILASNNCHVIGVDINQDTVETINRGKIHIAEPDLALLVYDSVTKGNLRATTQFEKANVFIITVPTPFKDNHQPDVSHVESAAKKIAQVLEKGNLIILESTSPVGTTEKMLDWMQETRPDLVFPYMGADNSEPDIAVAYCPERVLPGHIVKELVENDRIIGGVTARCSQQAKDLYKIFVKGDCLLTDCRTAELSKLVENAYRDVNIAFANELSLISDKLNVDVWELINLANRHPRVHILEPGPGVGGHCIAVDPWFIIDAVPDQARLIKTGRLINFEKPKFVLEKIQQAVDKTGWEKSALQIACLGLAFKPDIDDLRESPAMEISKEIQLMGFKHLYLVEPNINEIPEEFDSTSVSLTGVELALKSSDIIVILVKHKSFKNIQFSLLFDKVVVDIVGLNKEGRTLN